MPGSLLGPGYTEIKEIQLSPGVPDLSGQSDPVRESWCSACSEQQSAQQLYWVTSQLRRGDPVELAPELCLRALQVSWWGQEGSPVRGIKIEPPHGLCGDAGT